MMPLWMDLYEDDDADDALWVEFCDQCLEPLAVCKCGYAYDNPETDEEETELE